MRELSLRAEDLASLGTDILRSGRGFRFRACGSSMHPVIRNGDIISIKPADAKSIQIGEIAFCVPVPGRVVVHRVSAKRQIAGGLRIEIRGESGQAEEIDGACVLGRVVACERSSLIWRAIRHATCLLCKSGYLPSSAA